MWPHFLTAVIGVWLLASPGILGYTGSAQVNNQIVGAWIATFGLIAMAESVRAVRWANVVLGAWLICAPFMLEYADERAIGSIAMGLGTIALSCIRGTLSNRFGGGWSVLWHEASE
jgi:hypothetical protein